MITKKKAEPIESVPVEPVELVPLAELAAEGFGWGGAYVKTPRGAIRALANQLDSEVVLDDLGRQCVSRDTARRLLAERAAAERRQAEERERHWAESAELEARRPRGGGVPVPEGLEDADALTVLKMADSGAKRGEMVYRRMPDPSEPQEAGAFFQYPAEGAS